MASTKISLVLSPNLEIFIRFAEIWEMDDWSRILNGFCFDLSTEEVLLCLGVFAIYPRACC
jgi:hypothetical protein